MSDDYGLLHQAAEQNHSSDLPDAFYNNVGKLPDALKAKLSLHDLRCIYEFMVRPVIWVVMDNMASDDSAMPSGERLYGKPLDDNGAIEFTKADGWQPIETAPKDGTYFLAYPVLHLVPLTIVWDIKYGGWRVPLTQKPPPYNPTHWMPLPAVPDVEDQEGK